MKKKNMNIFVVEAKVCLGYYCFGAAVTETGFATLELTDEELKALTDLIRQSGTADVEEMRLQEKLPEIYEKLDEAYREAATTAEEDHWLEVGWENGEVFDPADHIEFGEKELGYKFEYDESEFMDEDGEIDEDCLEEAKMEDFSDWLTSYKDSLEDDERRKFMKKFIDVDVQEVEYKVKIPEEILKMSVNGEENSTDKTGR